MSSRTYVYFLDDISKPTPEAIAQHVAFLRALDDAGRLVVCGPFRDEGGGMVCFVAESESAAHATASADPFVTLGFKSYRLREIERATRDNGYLLG